MAYLYDFETVASNAVGRWYDDIQKLNDKRDRLSHQTKALSDKLESMSISAFDPSQKLAAINDVTGEVEHIDGRYRHIQLLPSVAAADRAATIKELTYFIENHPRRRFFRYAVITSGNRVEFGGNLRARRTLLHENMRRWSSEAEAEYGVKLLYRGDEYTFSDLGAHFHVNVIYWPTRKLSPEKWADFLSWSKRRLGGVVWKDCGVLNDAREVVKYICKLSSDKADATSYGVDALSSDNLAWFHHQTYRTKASQALGDFTAFRQELKAKGEKIVSSWSGGSRRLVRMKKEPGRTKSRSENMGKPRDAENVIVCRTLPRPGRSGVVSTWTMVLGYTPHPSTGCGNDGLRLIENNSQQAQEWAKGNGFYILDNNTPTVQTPAQEKNIAPRMDGVMPSIRGAMRPLAAPPKIRTRRFVKPRPAKPIIPVLSPPPMIRTRRFVQPKPVHTVRFTGGRTMPPPVIRIGVAWAGGSASPHMPEA